MNLTEIPAAGDDLEDYVAALFQASGYYVEKNLTERDLLGEVLELDLVATHYWTPGLVRVLGEVKGGKWGYSELFKLAGWMRYLGHSRGALFVKECDKDLPTLHARMMPLGIQVVQVGGFSSAVASFKSAGLGAPASESLVNLWRHSYKAERRLAKLLVTRTKSEPEKPWLREALNYQRLINDGVFFARDSVESLALLYEAFREHPKLTLSNAIATESGCYDPHIQASSCETLGRALRTGREPYLQACMYVEHRARLAILKAAVDYAIASPERLPQETGEEAFDWKGFRYRSLPTSFQQGVDWLRRQSNFRLYATFWQQFLWGWGGFYLQDRSREEFSWMSTYSGIPVDEIPVALSAFDQLFPTPEGWFVNPGWTSTLVTKLTPMIFIGLGAYHRRMQYDWADYNATNGLDYTATDLNRWNNSAVDFLL